MTNRMIQKCMFVFGMALVLTACNGNSLNSNADDETSAFSANLSENQTFTEGVHIPEVVPEVDTGIHSVPLDQIYFDTFQPVNRAVPLSQTSPEQIERLRDAIPPLHAPDYETAAEAAWLTETDVILGYASGGQAWAFPVRILNYHEIVNDVLGGVPVLISYCPLCYSGIVYDRQLEGETLTFGNTSALYESDMVMVDYQTGSYWWQVAGAAIVGPKTGSALLVLPSQMTTWKTWLDLYPETLVLSRQTGYQRGYENDPFATYEEYLNSGGFAFPVSEATRDDRLLPGARVLAVQILDEIHSFVLDEGAPSIVMDEIGGEPVVVFLGGDGVSGGAFIPKIGDDMIEFIVSEGRFEDVGTGSVWDLTGRAVSGELVGAQLERLPTKTTYWFSLVAAHPEVEVVGDE